MFNNKGTNLKACILFIFLLRKKKVRQAQYDNIIKLSYYTVNCHPELVEG